MIDRIAREAAIAKIEEGLREFDAVYAAADPAYDREPGEVLTKWVAVGLWEKAHLENPDHDHEEAVVYAPPLGYHVKLGLLTMALNEIDD